MTIRRFRGVALATAFAGVLVLPSCSRHEPVEVNPIVPSIEFNRTRVPLGSALEITYTWTLEPGAKKLGQDYRALVHFLDSHDVILFDDDHMPVPPPSEWEPGETYSYRRTRFVPVYPYVGEVEVRMGLYPYPGRGERPALKGEDRGFREYKVATMELLPQTENIFLVYKSGWHNPETHPENPGIERTWTEQEAVTSFKNPRKDVVVYLEADTCTRCFSETPVLTVAVGNNVGIRVPFEEPQVVLKKIRVSAEDLGDEEWVDLKLTMNESFVPNQLDPPLNDDDRELGLNVYNLYVAEADTVGSPEDVVDAEPLGPSAPPAQP
jgi:hypothetical protein